MQNSKPNVFSCTVKAKNGIKNIKKDFVELHNKILFLTMFKMEAHTRMNKMFIFLSCTSQVLSLLLSVSRASS